MVRAGRRGVRGFSDALKGDPSVEGAALVTVIGGDPWAYLNASGDQLAILTAVYQRAHELDTERRNAELKVILEAIGQLMKLIAHKPSF